MTGEGRSTPVSGVWVLTTGEARALPEAADILAVAADVRENGDRDMIQTYGFVTDVDPPLTSKAIGELGRRLQAVMAADADARVVVLTGRATAALRRALSAAARQGSPDGAALTRAGAVGDTEALVEILEALEAAR